jgi:DNA-binding response OmpR family regulator
VSTLLLSDDSVIVQRMIAMTFAAENIAVTTASDGEQAIARIAKDRPDIVLAAIATPKRSGYDVAAFIKSKPHLASIPVLLLAGAFDPVDQVRAAQVRCDGILVKPLEPQQVVARVKELIGRSSTGRAPAIPGSPPGEGLDDYFDQLDAALTQRSTPAPPSRTTDSGVVPTLDAVLTADQPAMSSGSEAFVNDALVDAVTRRVIERLGTDALRGTVADLVSEIAERLIREEIARIRSK